ncbi:hypothetical protein DY000_02022789 [Brassica cretica]|uniref:Uncharacterized protein n=1 Tax=Brassica cretica TaxID=69181 RepID=A0ABQ7ELN0_BRACR|nr:hypothetical protein DY000_02022789 [Brassica cretica]
MARLKNIVGDWKEKWRVLGDDAKEAYLRNDVWKGLKDYWNLPKSVQRDKFAFMANMFDLMIETSPNINPALASRWQSLRPSFVPEPTPAEQADLERRADEHSSGLFDEINLNT